MIEIIVGIVGCRWFKDYERFQDIIRNLPVIITEIISGGAEGVDSMAIKYARQYSVPFREYRPYWDSRPEGMHPAIHRNRLIAMECEYLVAFWDGISRGTKSTIDFARKFNKEIHIINIVKRDGEK